MPRTPEEAFEEDMDSVWGLENAMESLNANSYEIEGIAKDLGKMGQFAEEALKALDEAVKCLDICVRHVKEYWNVD